MSLFKISEKFVLNKLKNITQGNLKLINIESGSITEVKHNLKVLEDGQGGLLDVIYKDKYLWISYSEDRGSGKSNTSIVRGKFNNKNIDFKNIFQASPDINKEVSNYITSSNKPFLHFPGEEDYIDAYQKFYENFIEEGAPEESKEEVTLTEN